MRKGISLLLVVLLCCGYGYSSKKSSKADEMSVSKKSSYAMDSMTEKKTAEAATPAATPASAVPTATDIQGAAAAIKALSGGSPEEAKARLDAIKRVATAMANKQQQQ